MGCGRRRRHLSLESCRWCRNEVGRRRKDHNIDMERRVKSSVTTHTVYGRTGLVNLGARCNAGVGDFTKGRFIGIGEAATAAFVKI